MNGLRPYLPDRSDPGGGGGGGGDGGGDIGVLVED